MIAFLIIAPCLYSFRLFPFGVVHPVRLSAIYYPQFPMLVNTLKCPNIYFLWSYGIIQVMNKPILMDDDIPLELIGRKLSTKPLNIALRIREITRNGDDIVQFLWDVMMGQLIEKDTVIFIKVADRIAAADRLLDRGFGKVLQDLTVSGPDGGPIQSETLHVLASMSKDELLSLASPRLTQNGIVEPSQDSN
jgi:hypothetical protein